MGKYIFLNQQNQTMSELREKILAQEDKIGEKSRFGLFSQPPPIAVGDDSMYAKKQHERGGDGKPITKPPQLLSGTCRTGKTKSSYFSVPKSIHIEDKYQEQHKLESQYQKRMHTKANFHENEFKPASGTKSIIKSSYEYKEEKAGQGKKIMRDDGGRVKTQPPNIVTNPNSKVQQTFLKYPKYIEDPYERKAQMDRQYVQKEKQKTLNDAPMFKSASHGNRAFQKDSSAYGEDEKTKSVMKKKNIKMKTCQSQVAHEGPFKPGIKPNADPIGKYPQFINVKNPLPKNTKTSFSKVSNSTKNKELWKPNSFSKSRPTPSIGLNTQNLHIYRRKK